MTTEEKIAVMQAYVDGKRIESMPTKGSGTWTEDHEPEWNWEDYAYRV